MTDAPGYQVLARKHRPRDFDALVGQEVMVRTLANAFESDRIAHAFVLTGVRGVGKTTTARIIAKGLNCVGADGKGGPTIHPCGVCASCRAIDENRHMDVFEIDAASNTGVDFIRDLNQMVRYAPVESRYKIVILDEAHMLSTAAFNALLKTLEEPPAHVKFFFATTEIRKMPATVLSRCQRFDLRRIPPETLIDFLSGIAAAEDAQVSREALALVARAAEGSARDALTLMDRVIAHAGLAGGEIDAETARALLGFADRARGFDLLERIMAGDAKGALEELRAQHEAGAEPEDALRALGEIAHFVSVVKIDPAAADDPTLPEGERSRAKTLAEKLPMRALSRAWQMLLAALEEVRSAPSAMNAAEMAVIRLTHVADLPSPEEVLRKLAGEPGASAAGAPAPKGGGGGPTAAMALAGAGSTALAQPAPAQIAPPESYEALLALLRDRREGRLLVQAERFLAVSGFEPGRIGFALRPGAPDGLLREFGAKLHALTGLHWRLEEIEDAAPTIEETRAAEEETRRARAAETPLVAAALAAFPGARIRAIRPVETGQAADMIDEEGDLTPDENWSPIDSFDEG